MSRPSLEDYIRIWPKWEGVQTTTCSINVFHDATLAPTVRIAPVGLMIQRSCRVLTQGDAGALVKLGLGSGVRQALDAVRDGQSLIVQGPRVSLK